MSISAILVMTISFLTVISLTAFSLYKTITVDLSKKDNEEED